MCCINFISLEIKDGVLRRAKALPPGYSNNMFGRLGSLLNNLDKYSSTAVITFKPGFCGNVINSVTIMLTSCIILKYKILHKNSVFSFLSGQMRKKNIGRGGCRMGKKTNFLLCFFLGPQSSYPLLHSRDDTGVNCEHHLSQL